ncbi:MAG: SH3 domain-containing protein [Clostridia bacterium]|nr:SH3 domain-containing protein [Clostridia bacterium]
MKKTIFALVCALALCLGLCVTAQADFTAYVYNTDSLNIRSGPGTEYALLGSVAKDGLVLVTGESGNWYRVVALDSGISGYMSKNFLMPISTSSAQSAVYAVVDNTESLNVRSGPGTNYTWLATVARGGWVQIVGESGNWYQVRTVETGVSGYMSKNYLTVWNGQASSSTGSTAVVTNPAGTRFLNLREQPSYSANILDIFYTGETCTVLNRRSDGWWYVSAGKNGQTLYGYFRSEYLTVQAGGGAGSATVNTNQHGGNGGKLNLRDRPSAAEDSAIIARIPNGASVTVCLKGTTWWQVAYEGTVGFVDSGFLTGGGSYTPPSGGSTTPTITASAVVQTGNSGKLNLREQPSSDARILGRYANGTAVAVLQRGSTWCYVQAGTQKGYMMTKYLSVTGSSATRQVYNPNGGTYVNLRTSPQKNSSNVSVRVPVGATVTLLAWGEEWSQVSYNGKTGYMMTWFLK